MCSSKIKLQENNTATVSHMNGRPVLQPNCNNTTSSSTTLLYRRRRCNSFKNPSTTTTTTNFPPPLQPLSPPPTTKTSTPPASPKPLIKSPRPPAVKRGNDLNSTIEKPVITTPKKPSTANLVVIKKPKQSSSSGSLKYSSSCIVESPGSIAAARREEVANMQVQRKSRIAHYGRTKSSPNFGKITSINLDLLPLPLPLEDNKRCNFITPNSDPIYIAYHDEQWGVPVHDDKMLFELLLLTGAQVGSDWTCVLKKRQDFRDAFSGFDAESVSKYTEKKIISITAQYGIQLSLVRGVVDNSKRILEIKREFGSFDKYLWGFVNHKPIVTQYKSCFKIPVKTSKSETISKDMVKRGFRLVGPTVIHSFMQAAGLTNDHLLTCPQHLQCIALASQPASVAPAL